MIGYTRFLFSIIIMAAHLTKTGSIFAHWGVIGFYVLAGYFAVYAGEKSYSDPAQFLKARFFRLWPIYIVVFAATILLLIALPGISHNRTGIVYGWRFFAQSLMVVPNSPALAIVPIAWMLKWLLLGYLTVALGFMKTPRRAYLWLLFTLAWGQYSVFSSDYGGYYKGAATAMRAFAVGGIGYWLGARVPRDGRWAALFGAMAYPIYLVHPLSEMLGIAGGMGYGWPLFFAALPPTLALSWLLVVAVERPIAHYRKKFQTPSTEN